MICGAGEDNDFCAFPVRRRPLHSLFESNHIHQRICLAIAREFRNGGADRKD
jgi:hypothetical protein